jgi:hypothetical protein
MDHLATYMAHFGHTDYTVQCGSGLVDRRHARREWSVTAVVIAEGTVLCH